MREPAPAASLPMYDWPEVQWAHDALWGAIAARLKAHGIAAPARLDRSRHSEEVWLDPGLVLSQTCGYPFSTRLMDKVRLVATPLYDVPGCEGPYYSSVIVGRGGAKGSELAAFHGRGFATNARDSLSGHVALAVAMREAGLDPAVADWIETGSHRESVRAVAEGRADVAAIDPICWALAKEFEPGAASRLEVIAETPLRPGLPLITARNRSDQEVTLIRAALDEALTSGETARPRAALHLAGTAILEEALYAPIAALGG